METKDLASIGIFGGSGFYKFLDDIEEINVDTPYGKTSDAIMLGTIGGKKVAFMPRHGRNHSIAPHKVNYRANVWAMKSIGCKRVISPCAAGSLQTHVKPGDIVFCDQYFFVAVLEYAPDLEDYSTCCRNGDFAGTDHLFVCADASVVVCC